MILNLLLLGHILSDFYLQNDTTIDIKSSEKISFLNFYKTEIFKHAVVYIFLSSLILTIYSSENLIDYCVLFLAFISHGFIDYLKIKFLNKYEGYKKQIFLLDQGIHILILFLLSEYISMNFTSLSWITLDNTYLSYIIVLLLIGKTANVIFGILLNNYKPENQEMNDGFKNVGGLIGIMERILIFMFLLTGNMGSIGFIIAAKSVVRYKKLSDTQFAEYFLLGTFFSVLYTLLTYYLFYKL